MKKSTTAAFIKLMKVSATTTNVWFRRHLLGQIVSDEWNYFHAVTARGDKIIGDFGYGGWRRAVWALIAKIRQEGELQDCNDTPRTRAEWLRLIASYQDHAVWWSPATVNVLGDAGRYAAEVLKYRPDPLPPGGYSKPTVTILAEDKESARVLLGAAELQQRYKRFCHYVTEIKPGWKRVREIAYADNSVEVEEINLDGQTRRRMTVGPAGDRCF